MAGPFDAIGQWLNDRGLGGGAGAGPGVKSQYVQNGPGGLHQFSVMTDGTLRDDGVIDPKSAQTKPQIVKDDAGGVYAYLPNPGNADQPFTRQTIIAPDASKADFTQSATDKNDADVQSIYQRMADAQAMLPYNKDKASATIANLWSEVSNRSARTGIDSQKLQGQLQRWASQNGLDQSKLGLNQAHGQTYVSQAGKLDAQTDVILQGAFAGLQQKYAQIDSLMGKPGGPADQAAADALKKQVFDQAAREAATGLTANQAATNATTQRGQDVTQADARAGQMSSFLSNYGRDISTAKMPPGSTGAGDFLGAMLGHWGDLMGTAGGNPVPASGTAQSPPTGNPAQQQPLVAGTPADAGPDGMISPGRQGLSITTLPPADLQRIHDRTQQLAASGMDLGSAAKQAMGEYVSGTPAPGTAPAAQFDGAAGAQPADPLAGINPGYKIPAGQPGSFLGSMVGSA